jgi:ankyrin repeat protein
MTCIRAQYDFGRNLRALCLVFLGLAAAFLSPVAVADDAHDFFLAISFDNAYSVSKLLQHGVDPNLKESTRGDPSLVFAIRENAMKAFTVLLDDPKIDLDAHSNNGDTALMVASFLANKTAVLALLDKDVEVNKTGWTALHYAASSGDCDIIKLLLDKSAYIDAESPNKTTPVMMAARSGQMAAVKMLIEAGADISLKNDQGMSAADFATAHEFNDIAELLKSVKH